MRLAGIWVVLALVAAGAVAEDSNRGVLGIDMDYTVDAAGKGRMTVLAIVPGSAAEKSGLQAGDVVVEVDNQSLLYPTSLDFYKSPLFPAGVPAELKVERSGQQILLTIVPDRSTDQLEKVSSHMAALERCKGDVACASGCADAPTVVRTESDFFKTLDAHPSSPIRLTLKPGPAGGSPILLSETGNVDYQSDIFLQSLVKDLSPLLGKVERVEVELRRSEQGFTIKYLYPEPSVLLGLLN